MNRKQYEGLLGKIDQFGFELYEEIIAEILLLEATVKSPDDTGGDF